MDQTYRSSRILGWWIKAVNFNSRALLTNNAKETLTILQTTYEGTKAGKDSKLQRLTSSFKEIRMEEDETFDEFYAKLKDIVNSSFNLGEKSLSLRL